MSAITPDAVLIDGRSAHRVDAPLVRLDEEQQEAFRAKLKGHIERMFTRPDGLPDNAPQNRWGEVIAGGQVVATLDNSGGVAMSNAVGGQLAAGLPNDGGGPDLARRRADYIARMLGGRVEMASTAQTQAQWAARPERTTSVDWDAMKAAGFYERWKALGGGSAAVQAQILAQRSDD